MQRNPTTALPHLADQCVCANESNVLAQTVQIVLVLQANKRKYPTLFPVYQCYLGCGFKLLAKPLHGILQRLHMQRTMVDPIEALIEGGLSTDSLT